MKKRKKAIYLKEVELKYKMKKVDGKIIGKRMTDARTVVKLFSDLQNETREKLICINLDAKNKILCFEVVAIGSVEAIFLRPGETFRTSLMVNAYGVIILHNHPSGDPQPSQEDKKFTARLRSIADTMGLILHDHIIIGTDSYYSFAEQEIL